MKVIPTILLTIMALVFVGCNAPQPADDSGITTKVKTKLFADTRTSAVKISVETVNGVVTLTGTVPTQAEKAAAGEIAKNTEGVQRVDNQVTVNPNSLGASNAGEKAGEAVSEAEQMVGDAGTTAKIKAKFIAAGIIGTNVDTVNGAVTLRGHVDNAKEKALAEMLAKETEDVKRVKNELVIEKK
ncbi:MAG: BON domain-containing protein [Acidobacteria bacterium]|nr:BON domain-containing protein [Acidobacteriota bacterium]MBI3428022.1 BON domain-containing protein [Acidobacteriota bacterium]